MGFVVAQAAAVGAGDVVLEPSAGTGLLALFAEGRNLHLNELEPQRRALLQQTFPHMSVSDHNGEYIDDLLPRGFLPSVVMMKPGGQSSQHGHPDKEIRLNPKALSEIFRWGFPYARILRHNAVWVRDSPEISPRTAQVQLACDLRSDIDTRFP